VNELPTGAEAFDPATVAVLAHGLLNSLSAVQVAVDVLLRSHGDRALADRLGGIVAPQLAMMEDGLRLLVRGLPDDVLDQLLSGGASAID
jgi:hypothetical protein